MREREKSSNSTSTCFEQFILQFKKPLGPQLSQGTGKSLGHQGALQAAALDCFARHPVWLAPRQSSLPPFLLVLHSPFVHPSFVEHITCPALYLANQQLYQAKISVTGQITLESCLRSKVSSYLWDKVLLEHREWS